MPQADRVGIGLVRCVRQLLRRAVPADKAAARAGRGGMLRLGLDCLEALAASFGEEAVMPREELLGVVLPTALVEHDLLRGSSGA